MSRFAAVMYAFAGFSGLVVVAFEALAAHGLAGFAPTGEQAVVWFNQATSFQMTQTFALILATAIAERLPEGLGQHLMRKAAVLFLLAAVLFPGGLYSGSFNGPLTPAPFGGVAAMAGWVLFGVSAWFGYRDTNREGA